MKNSRNYRINTSVPKISSPYSSLISITLNNSTTPTATQPEIKSFKIWQKPLCITFVKRTYLFAMAAKNSSYYYLIPQKQMPSLSPINCVNCCQQKILNHSILRQINQ